MEGWLGGGRQASQQRLHFPTGSQELPEQGTPVWIAPTPTRTNAGTDRHLVSQTNTWCHRQTSRLDARAGEKHTSTSLESGLHQTLFGLHQTLFGLTQTLFPPRPPCEHKHLLSQTKSTNDEKYSHTLKVTN